VVDVGIELHLVSARLESGPPALMTLVDDAGEVPTARVSRSDVMDTASRLVESIWEQLGTTALEEAATRATRVWEDLRPRDLSLAGAHQDGGALSLVCTALVVSPLAEVDLDIAGGSTFGWRVLSESAGRRTRGARPVLHSGAEAIVLDHWRQALEETDVALDFLPGFVNLLQLRGLYDAVWGYDQDASGFKRWAVDRPGAFRDLLAEAPSDDLDAAFYQALAHVLPPESAAMAGALTSTPTGRGSLQRLGPVVGLAAATTVNRLYPRPGPEPAWFTRSDRWRAGPSWIENLYPPRPSWTRWDVADSG
jgi:hypothetical protein